MSSWTVEEFAQRLRDVGTAAYHDQHPFHQRMNSGALSREQIQLWVANRFYYQKNLPIKDATLISRCPIREIRQVWIQRILDHDGYGDDPGGIEKWLRLADATGLDRADLDADRFLLPGVRFAVDAYVRLVATRSWIEGVASSLTELFAPNLMATRLEAFERHYPWIDRDALAYFRARLYQAPRDSDHGMSLVLEHCQTRVLQEAAIDALQTKCQILWAQLDAMDHYKPTETSPA
ncbi:MAG: pyrroloquinoline-quinone synthase PqqC [Planctomycetota bacterium]|nr:pyrroloquinoline-quinone synthase PqqC [Planctomycetota bacterium]